MLESFIVNSFMGFIPCLHLNLQVAFAICVFGIHSFDYLLFRCLCPKLSIRGFPLIIHGFCLDFTFLIKKLIEMIYDN